MKSLTAAVFAAALGAGALALTATSASARIVCNAEGDCWHVVGPEFEFPAAVGIIVHPDDWKWREGERFRWHEHEGRGYWRGGAWVDVR